MVYASVVARGWYLVLVADFENFDFGIRSLFS